MSQKRNPTVVALIWLVIGSVFLIVPVQAGGWSRHTENGLMGPSVGRNAATAIPAGLARQGAGWIDTMAAFYADPRTNDRDYFAYGRRPYGRPARLRR